MTDKQFTVYLQQLKTKVDVAYNKAWDAIQAGEARVVQEKTVLGPIYYIPALSLFSDLQDELEESIKTMEKEQPCHTTKSN